MEFGKKLGLLSGMIGGNTKNPSILKDILGSPDDFKIEASIEDGELVIRVRRKTVAVSRRKKKVIRRLPGD